MSSQPSDNSKIITIHPASDNLSVQPDMSLNRVTLPAPAFEHLAKPPGISVRLDMDRVVFLIPDVQELPELDVHSVKDCTMRFHLLPGLLISPQKHQIVCPLLFDQRALPAKVQLLTASTENENPFYGLSMFAKVATLQEYMDLVPSEIVVRLPYGLVKELFPAEAASIVITDDMLPHSVGEDQRSDQVTALKQKLPIPVTFTLPTGHRLPELYRGKIVRISLNLCSRSGGLALNDRSTQLVNSLSRPVRVHVDTPEFFAPPADDYYQLRSLGTNQPITSQLPEFYEDYTEMLDPTAAMLARRGIKF